MLRFIPLILVLAFNISFAQTPILHLPLDGNTNDVSGNAINGTASNASLTTDRFNNPNKAYSFNGVNSFISIPYNNLFKIPTNGAFTIILWAQPSVTNTAGAIFVRSPYNANHYLSQWDYGIYQLNSQFMSGYGGNHLVYSTGNITAASCWYHLALTYNNKTWKLYVNGTLHAQENSGNHQVGQSNGGIALGKKGEANGDYYNGKLDDVKMYNIELSSSQILDDYNQNKLRDINITSDTSICLGDSIRLSASGGVSYAWSPSVGLSNSNVANPIAKPNVSTMYKVQVQTSGCIITDSVFVEVKDCKLICSYGSLQSKSNLVVNGNFEQGNTGFTTPLTYVASPTELPGNSYTITNNASAIHWAFSGYDHTSGSGKFLAINGPDNPTNVWVQTINVTPNKYYRISAWFNNIVKAGVAPGGIANVEFRIDGVKISNNLQVEQFPDVWLQMDTLWFSGSSTSVVFSIYNNANQLQGNDFAIDDIEFKECGCNPIPAIPDQTICLKDSILLTAQGGTSYLWQPANEVNNPTAASVYVKPQVSKNYIVTITNGICISYDTILVNVVNNCCPDCADPFDINKDLLICYPFTNNTNDESGNGHHGTKGNTATSAVDRLNRSNNSYNFDGSVQAYIETPQSPILNTAGFTNFSYACWINIGPSTTNLPRRVMSVQDANNRNYDISFVYDSMKLNFINYNVSSSNINFLSKQTLQTGIWYHVALVIDSTNKTSLYINGRLDNAVNIPIVKPINPIYYVGKHRTQNWNFIGKIDDVRFYKRALSPNEIINLMPLGLKRKLENFDAGVDQFICKNDSTKLQASNAYHYTWTPASLLHNTASQEVYTKPLNDSALFFVQGRSGYCEASDSVKVKIKTPSASAGLDIETCLSTYIRLSASGGDSYEWFPHPNLDRLDTSHPLAWVSKSDTFVVKINAQGCVVIDTVFVRIKHQVPLMLERSKIVCVGDSVVLNVSSSAIGTTFLWKRASGGLLNDSNTSHPSYRAYHKDTLFIEATSGSCSTIDTVIVDVVTPPLVNAGPDVSICLGDTITLNGSGGSGLTWYPNINISDTTIATPKVFPLITQQYILKHQLYNCINYDTVIVTVKDFFIEAGPNEEICYSDSIQLGAISVGNYQWKSSSYISDNNTSNPWVKPLQTDTFFFRSMFDGCTKHDTLIVVVNMGPTLVTSVDTAICKGDSIQLTVSGATIYAWYPNVNINDSSIATPFVYPDQNQVYVVKGINSGTNCYGYDSIKITVSDLPDVFAGNDTVICKDASVQLLGQSVSADIYEWTPSISLNNPNIPNPIHQSNINTQYILKVSNSSTGCSNSDTLNVTARTIKAAFEVDKNEGNAPLLVKFNNKSIPDSLVYHWIFGDSTSSSEKHPNRTFEDRGVYKTWLIVTDSFGCIDTSEVTEITVMENRMLFIPNVFTPNNDGVNEFFEITYDLFNVKKLTGTIWNRWGDFITEFEMPNGQWWDGTYNGKTCPEGVYVYIIHVTDRYDVTRTYYGTVTVLY
jgi:gliding motility-associated-like protein